MEPGNDWKILFQDEISQAEEARSAGNEGMARVCARRAAGILLGEFFSRYHIVMDNPSAIDRLRLIQKMPGISEDVLVIAGHFLEHVNPDHNMPLQVDLIAEARSLEKILLDVSVD